MADIIKEIREGNGNQFTVKETLQEFIRTQTNHNDYVRERFDKGTCKIATIKNMATENKTGIFYIKWMMGGLFALIPIVFTILYNIK